MAHLERYDGLNISDYRHIYLRAWSEPPQTDKEPWRPPWPPDSPRTDRILVIDVETTTTVSQRLTFGFAALCETTRSNGRVTATLIAGWRFYADDLDSFDPDAYRTLTGYVAEDPGPGCVDDCCWRGTDAFPMLSQTEFLDEVFWGLAHKARVPVVGFNLPFDLSMMARHAGTAPGGHDFSFDYWGRPGEDRPWDRPPYRPGLRITRRGSGHYIRFTGYRDADKADTIPGGSADGQPDTRYRYRGHFWDLSQIAFALTAKRTNLHRTGKDFSARVLKTDTDEHGTLTPDYIAYNRHDVAATVALFEQVMTEFERHPIVLLPERAYSPASIGKAYLDAMGVIPPLRKWPGFPRDLLGRWCGAYFAGRSEMRARHISLPVVYSDAVAMFPTVCALIGIWEYDIAAEIEIVDWTQQLQELLDKVAENGPDVVFDPEVWKTFVTIAEIIPDGNIVPVRADYDDTPDNNKRVGVSAFAHDEALPYTAAGLVASTLLTRTAPRVLRAWRLIPKGTQEGLRPVEFRGQIPIEPSGGDFYKFLVEDRYSWQGRYAADPEANPDAKWIATGEKILNNALSYGAKMEFNPQAAAGPSTVTGYDEETLTLDLTHPEVPGRFCFPPLAATITAGARLFIALRERLTADAGGTHYLCDTDSMAIIATEHGGPIPCPRPGDHPAATWTADGQPAVNAISWAADDEIRERFNTLNPYNPDLIPDLWKIEKENYNNNDPDSTPRQLYAFGISAKRYTFHLIGPGGQPIVYDPDGAPAVIKPSEHGLGALLNPLDPDGKKKLAPHVWAYTVARAHDPDTRPPAWLQHADMRKQAVTTPHVRNAFDSYNAGKPYAEQIKPFSFMMHPNIGRGRITQPAHFIAPYDPDPDTWASYDYTDTHTGSTAPGLLIIKWATLDTTIRRWATNPETVATGPDAEPCGRTTAGLLSRRSITSAAPLVTLIGKEAGAVETDEDPAEDNASTHLAIYPRVKMRWRTVAKAVRRLGIANVARRAGVSERGLSKGLEPETTPHRHTRDKVLHATADAARETLDLTWKDDLRVLTAYTRTPRLCHRCGRPLPENADHRRRYCKDATQCAVRAV